MWPHEGTTQSLLCEDRFLQTAVTCPSWLHILQDKGSPNKHLSYSHMMGAFGLETSASLLSISTLLVGTRGFINPLIDVTRAINSHCPSREQARNEQGTASNEQGGGLKVDHGFRETCHSVTF